MSSFNIDELRKAIDSIKTSLWENEGLDNFMKNNNDISKVMLVTPLESMKDIRSVPTKYGILKVKYSAYIPRDKCFFVREPDLSELFKPDFKMKESEDK